MMVQAKWQGMQGQEPGQVEPWWLWLKDGARSEPENRPNSAQAGALDQYYN
jgi:hypothetical protein